MTDDQELDLERDLIDLGRHLDIPAAPQLPARVANLIEGVSLRPGRPFQRRRVGGAVVAVVVGAAAVAAAPVVADWFRVGGVEVRQEPAPPALSRLGRGLDLGDPVSLAEAESAFGRPLLRSDDLGDADEVWLDTAPGVPIVTFLYRPGLALPATSETGVGALFSQVDASIAERSLWTKFAGDGASVSEVAVGGARGLWIEGSHYVALRDSRGNVIAERVRLAANVLLWERDGLTLRLETALDRDAAVAIGRSVR